MTYNKKKKRTRQERVNEATEKMQSEIESYFQTPEQLKEYLSFMGQFYNYSPRNSALIHSQFRGAEAVGSFKFWKEKGFSVQKGEKSIEILTPNKTTHKYKSADNKWKNIKYATESEKSKIKSGVLEEKRPRLYFTMGHVFDVSQTDATAKDLPDIFPNRWLEGNVESYENMMQSYKEMAKDINVTVGEPLDELGSAKGAFYFALNNGTRGHIGLNPRNGQLQNVKTMAHELAHAKLHHGERAFKLTDAEKEFQAEMVAYTVSDYFGIDTSEYSLKYLANWSKGKEFDDKIKLVEEIRETSVEFISKLENGLIKERNITHENTTETDINEDNIISENHVSKQEINKENDLFWYELKNRPVSIGTQPKGFKEVDHDKGDWGVIAYKEPLSQKDIDEYELKPFDMKALKEVQKEQNKKEHELEV